MAERNEAVIGIAWLAVLIMLVAALVVGGLKVLSDFSAEQGYRWMMALFFLGGSFAWLTARYQDTLRSYFKR